MNGMGKEIICIACPIGCRMDVALDGGRVKAVQGNQCEKGEEHAIREVRFPGRVLTTTVKTDIPGVPLLPVRSDREIPKDRLLDCMRVIARHRVCGSVRLGEAVIENILGTGADIVACRTAPYRHASGDMKP